MQYEVRKIHKITSSKIDRILAKYSVDFKEVIYVEFGAIRGVSGPNRRTAGVVLRLGERPGVLDVEGAAGLRQNS